MRFIHDFDSDHICHMQQLGTFVKFKQPKIHILLRPYTYHNTRSLYFKGRRGVGGRSIVK